MIRPPGRPTPPTESLPVKRITHEIVVEAAPERVWGILADIPSYPEWNRSTRIVLDPKTPDLITYGLTAVRPNGKELPWTLNGRLLIRRSPERLSWRLGLPGFVFLAMSYALTPRGAGTHVLFTAEVSGLVPRIFPKHFPNLLPQPMLGTLQALKRRAETGRPKPIPRSSTPKKVSTQKKLRHGGPPPRRR